jgi:uncharacterized membrane protein HdeD (DUF308 family)
MMEDNWVWRITAGLAMIALGILLLAYTGITLLILLDVFGIVMLFVGAVELVFGVSTPKGTAHRGVFVLRGIISILIGAFALLLPGLTLLAALYLIASWAIVWGLLEMAAALIAGEEHRLHVYGRRGRPFALVAGVLAVLLGLIIIVYPEETLGVLVFLLGFTTILVGALVAVSGFHSRDKKREEGQLT